MQGGPPARVFSPWVSWLDERPAYPRAQAPGGRALDLQTGFRRWLMVLPEEERGTGFCHRGGGRENPGKLRLRRNRVTSETPFFPPAATNLLRLPCRPLSGLNLSPALKIS